MTVVDPSDALQVGIFTRLTGDAPLMALLTPPGVVDHTPENIDGSYVTIGETFSVADGTHTRPGRQTTATLHTWTLADSWRPSNDIGAALVRLLDKRDVELNAVVPGHNVWMIKWEFHQGLREGGTTRDARPHIRHRIDRFRIYTSQLEAP